MGLRELKFIEEWERRSFAAAVIKHFVVVGGADSLFNSESKNCGHFFQILGSFTYFIQSF